MTGPFSVEARSIGGYRRVLDLTALLDSWEANVATNAVTGFVGTYKPGTDCSDAIAGLEPWWTEITVTDDKGRTLWEGPMVESPARWSRQKSSVTLNASTVLWWAQRRVVRTNIDHAATAVPAAQIVGEVFTSAFGAYDPNLIPYLVVHAGSDTMMLSIAAYESMAWNAISELLGATVDVWCRGRAIHIAKAGEPQGRLGPFGIELVAGAWLLRKAGAIGATSAWVRGADGLIVHGGGPIISTDGSGTAVLVESLMKDEKLVDTTTAQKLADARVMTHAPMVLETDDENGWIDCSVGVEPIDLAPNAGLTLELPGGGVIDARITDVRFGFDGTEYKCGVRIMDRNAVVIP